jgi:TatD DNase family protein
MSFLIDTHAHLYLPEFDADRDKVVENALQRGVEKIFLPNIDSASIDPVNAMAGRFPGVCYPMMGLHPTSVKEQYLDELSRIEYELEHGRYYGIGEIGLDLYWDKTHIRQQCDVFARQLDLSLRYQLPVIIHARESFHEILEILEGYHNKGLKGIFHAFTGGMDVAEQVTGMGFMLGIGGIITYNKSHLPEVVQHTPLENLVLETDAPYLSPVPFRGKRNESSYIHYIAEALQQIKKISLEEIAGVTTQNVLRIFSLENARQ